MRLDQIADAFLETEFGDLPREKDYDGPCELIDADRVDDLTDALMRFVAEVVVCIVDAGSEREVVVENEALRGAIFEELKGWDSAEWRRERGNG